MSATKCPECGFGYVPEISSEIERHNAFHDEHVYGPATGLSDGIHFVTPESPPELRKTAGDAARVARRDTPYDLPLYSAEEQPSDSNPIIALEVHEGRAIAIIVTREKDIEYRVSLDDFEPNSMTQSWRPTKGEKVAPHRKRAIEFIWVLQRQRGTGVPDRLLRDLQGHIGHPLCEFAHALPFTEAAVKFWRKRGVNEFYIA
ncbi:MAG TPA: hypothetical protein VKO18_05415 [Terriglobia bacterium]|nr:hypothetical protein [Terriglobia bacterium]